MNVRSRRIPQERGVALITALLFLLILMVLGTTGVMNNTLQERMAANARNRDLAFQAAEHALDAADTWMMTGDAGSPQTKASLLAVLDPNGDGNFADQISNDGIRDIDDRAVNDRSKNDDDYWRSTFDWTSADLRSAPGNNLTNIQAQPRYVVEKLPGYLDPTAGNPCSGGCDYYRVTARGVGGVGEAAVILQTLYQIQ